MHHEAKIDSPSGTALSIANKLLEDRDTSFTRTTTEKETIKGKVKTARPGFKQGKSNLLERTSKSSHPGFFNSALACEVKTQ